MSLHIKSKKYTRSTRELYALSKFVYNEAFLEGYLNAAGPQRERYVKNLEKNTNSVKRQARFLKFFSGLFIALMSLIAWQPLQIFKEQVALVNDITFSAFLFAIASPITILFGTHFLFLFTYGITSVTGIFGGQAFKLLEILPFNDKERRKILFFTFFKTLNLQIIAIFLSLPVLTIIIIRNPFAIFMAFVISAIHVLFCIGLMLLVSNFMARKIFTVDDISRGKSILRVLVSLLYMVTAMLAGITFNILFQWIGELFTSSLMIGESGLFYNQILSFVLWPYSLAYLFGLSILPMDATLSNFSQWWTILVGFTISVIFIAYILKKGVNVLVNATKEEEGGGHKEEESEFTDVKISTKGPVKAIISKDLKFFLRNFQMMIYLIIPIITPLVGTFSASPAVEFYPQQLWILNLVNLIYYAMSIVFLTIAVTSAENETGDLLYSLPIKSIQVYKAKRTIMVPTMLLSLIFPTFYMLYFVPEYYLITTLNAIAWILIFIYGTDYALMLYARLFGKIRNKYAILLVNVSKKSIKSILGVISIFLIMGIPEILILILTATILPLEQINIMVYVITCIISAIIMFVVRHYTMKTFNAPP
ncbi:MAG: hypothetical protein GF364_01715 [Candidatus Lokiarchaeota archaeon]|nr:hypothetical protein [Candidatus Lokiarchaeota archaeon]